MQEENQRNGAEEAAGQTTGTTAVGTVDGPRADGPRIAGDEAPTSAPGAGDPGTEEPCARCGQELSIIRIRVDGNTLLMESCDGCDARRWQLAGERIDLQEALDQVGEHSGRRPKR